MDRELEYRLVFLILGLLLGYAVGAAHIAMKYAKKSESESHEVLNRLEDLIAKIDVDEINRDQEMSDMDDRMQYQERHDAIDEVQNGPGVWRETESD
jgi:hypothetical protein